MEIWKQISGYDRYFVSNYGRVKTTYQGKEHILSPRNKYKNREGKAYYHVRLSKDGKLKDFFIHRLVAIAFIPNPLNKATVNHIDGNKFNNNVNNLEWATIQEQHDHAIATGLIPNGGKNKVCPIYKITDITAREIKIAIANGDTITEIAKRYSVSKTTIYSIKTNKIWKHIEI